MHRIHYLDNLRALAMMLGVFLHAGLAYAYPLRRKSGWQPNRGAAWRLMSVSGSFICFAWVCSSCCLVTSGPCWYGAKASAVFEESTHSCRLAMILFYPFLAGAMTLVIIAALSMAYKKLG